MNEIKVDDIKIKKHEIVNKIIEYIKKTKPIDLWQRYLDILYSGKYSEFIKFVYNAYGLNSKLTKYCDELLELLDDTPQIK